MAVKVRVTIDHPALRAAVTRIAGETLQRGAQVSEQRMRGEIVAADLVNTGALLASITTQPKVSSGVRQSVLIGTPLEYAKYPEYGTRAHGPVRAKALRFKPKGSSVFVFAKWVRGVRPYRYAQKTLDQVRPSDFV